MIFKNVKNISKVKRNYAKRILGIRTIKGNFLVAYGL